MASAGGAQDAVGCLTCMLVLLHNALGLRVGVAPGMQHVIGTRSLLLGLRGSWRWCFMALGTYCQPHCLVCGLPSVACGARPLGLLHVPTSYLTDTLVAGLAAYLLQHFKCYIRTPAAAQQRAARVC
jgi:hypothetical protein